MEGQVERLGTRPDAEREDRRADERGIRQHSEDEGEGRQRLDDRDDHRGDGGIGHANHVCQRQPLVDDGGVDLRDLAELVVQGLPVDEPGLPFEARVAGP